MPSFIDYPGKSAAIVFLSGCNYRCPACHSRHVIETANKSEEEFFDYINKNKGFIDGIVVCGGEPTMQAGLLNFLKKLKSTNGFSVKLDTNGSNPQVLEEVNHHHLANYVAMDVKAPRELYDFVAGKEVNFSKIEESMRIVSRFPDYEFRTTIAPVCSNGSPKFMTVRNVGDIASWILHATGKMGSSYYLQKFIPRAGGLINPELEKFPETPKELLEEMKIKASKYLYKTEIRN